MSIVENIAFGIRRYERLPKSELADRVETALHRAALWDDLPQPEGRMNAVAWRS